MVKKVGQKDVSKQTTCKHCGAILKYLPADVKYCSLSSMCEPAGGYYYIVCPECKRQVELKSHK